MQKRTQGKQATTSSVFVVLRDCLRACARACLLACVLAGLRCYSRAAMPVLARARVRWRAAQYEMHVANAANFYDLCFYSVVQNGSAAPGELVRL